MGLVKLITKPIGCVFTLIGVLVVGLILLVVGMFWAIDSLSPGIVERAMSEATGFPTTVRDGEVSFRDQAFTLTDIEIENPGDFPDREFMHIATFSVGLDRDNWNEQQMALSEVTLQISELTYILGDSEVSNLETFIEAAEDNWGLMIKQIQEQAAAKDQKVPDKLVIGALNLGLQRVKLAQIQGEETIYRAIDLNYAKSFSNVDSIRPIIESIAADLQNTGLPQIAAELRESAKQADNNAALQLLQNQLEQQYQKAAE